MIVKLLPAPFKVALAFGGMVFVPYDTDQHLIVMSNRQFFPAVYIILIMLSVSGCSPKYYVPNSVNTPLLTQKGEFMANGLFNDNRGELQLAYAPAANLGIVANGTLFFPKDQGNGNGGNGSFFEAGAGYFLPMPNNFVFETYALLGFGSLENYFPESVQTYPGTNGRLDASVFRISLQPSFGYKSRYFEAAVSARAGMINYSGISGNLVTGDVNQQQYLENNKGQLMIEPALTLRGGVDFLKLQLQLGSSVNMTNSAFPQDKGWMTIGLHYRLRS